jgi:hypothetical protein
LTSASVVSSASAGDGNRISVYEKPHYTPASQYQYATLGQTSIIEFSDDSDDDDLLDDVKPTFKSSSADSDDDLLEDVKPTFKSEK